MVWVRSKMQTFDMLDINLQYREMIGHWFIV